MSLTIEVLANGNCTMCRQQEINATILSPDTTHYLFTPWSRALPGKLTGSQVDKKFPAFYGTRRFIIAFKSARYLSLLWANSIQSTPPHPSSWRSILIFSSHLSLCLPSGLFPSSFPTKTLYTLLLSPHVLHAPPISFSRFNHPNNSR